MRLPPQQSKESDMRMLILAVIASIAVAFVGAAYWDSAGFATAERSTSTDVRLD